MRRRDLIALLGGAATLLPFAGHAQQGDKMRRIGILAAAPAHPIDSFRERLRELGWSEGHNIEFAYRWAEGDDTHYPVLASELITLQPNVILTWGTPAAFAAKQATSTLPIVMGSVGTLDTGVVRNLAHPGGNITGFSSQNVEISGKHIGLLKDLLPGITRVAVLSNATNPAAIVGAGTQKRPPRLPG